MQTKYYSITYFLKDGRALKYRNVKAGDEYKLMNWIARKIGPVVCGNMYEKQPVKFFLRIYPVSP